MLLCKGRLGRRRGISLSLARRRRWREKGTGAVAWEQGAQRVHPQRRVLHLDGALKLPPCYVFILWFCVFISAFR
jgi:hypothetical protein